MKRSWRIPALALLGVIALAGCAPLANELVNTAPVGGQIAGFWQGLWHGLITPFAFVVSLFSGNVGIYEAHNNGAGITSASSSALPSCSAAASEAVAARPGPVVGGPVDTELQSLTDVREIRAALREVGIEGGAGSRAGLYPAGDLPPGIAAAQPP